jgi:site-specific recombinase XerD
MLSSTKQVFRSRTVHELLGCSEVRTAMIYTHALNHGMAGVRSQLDRR